MMPASFDVERLIDEAIRQPFTGWDFSWLRGRLESDELPWDFSATAARRLVSCRTHLDLGTGGGEWLASLDPRGRRTVATESFSLNLSVANGRLARLEVGVVQVESAPDNADQLLGRPAPRLPFRDEQFDLVTARHESFVASEVARVLVPGGTFLTQQTGPGDHYDLYPLLGIPVPTPAERLWDLRLAVVQVESAGMWVTAQGEATFKERFHDIGALVYYMKAIPWAVPGFEVTTFRERLGLLQTRIEEQGPLECLERRFWLHAIKT